MSVSADHFFLARAEQRVLLLALRSIPQLVSDLAVTITGQARLGGQVRTRRGSLEELFIMNLDAHAAAEQLHACLVTWIQVVCEQRSLDLPTDIDATPAAARWLDKRIIALAMTEGAQVAYGDITKAVKHVEWIVCPPIKSRADVNIDRLREAEAWELNANGIAAAARELDERYRNLTVDRVHRLARRGHIEPVRWYGDIPVYRLGDVLIAHLSVPIRRSG